MMFGTLISRIANVLSVLKAVLENLYVEKDGHYVSIIDAVLGKGDCEKCRELESDPDPDTEGDDYTEWRGF